MAKLTSELSDTSKHKETVGVILFKSFTMFFRTVFLLPQTISLNPI